jgi:hypothetical protein
VVTSGPRHSASRTTTTWSTQPLLAVGLVAVIRKILFVLSSEEPVSTAELALLIAMIAVFVAALILVSRYDRTDAGR